MLKRLFTSRTITILMFAVAMAVLIFAMIQGVSAKESSKKAWLGVQIQELTPSLRESFKLGDKTGVLITEVVDDSPADDANLREEDVIIEFAGQSVEYAEAFTKLVRNSEPGKEVKVVVIRDGARKEIMVTLAARKTPRSYSAAWSGGPMSFFGSRMHLGVQTHDLDADLAGYFNVKEDGGALVLTVYEDTPAEKAGLKAGDVITKVDDESIDDPEDLARAIADYEEDDEITITYVRHGKTATAKATLEESDRGSFHYFHAPGKERIRILEDGKVDALRHELEAKRQALDAARMYKLAPRAPLPLKTFGRETI
jgi:serine protease Do